MPPESSDHLRPLRPLGIVLLALAVALLTNTIAGPLVTGLVEYPISGSMLNQLLGLELVTVFLVVPVTAVAGVLAVRERPLAPLLAIGPSAYAAYMFAQYVIGPLYDRYTVTVLAHLAIATTSGVVMVWSWLRAIEVHLPVPDAHSRRHRTAWLGFLAAFVLLRYAALFTGAVPERLIPVEFADEPAFYWSIVLLDLGVVVPATILAAAAVHRRSPVAQHAYYAVVGWFAMVPPSVAAMAAVMVAREDPHASLPTLLLTAIASVLFAVPAVAAVRDLSRKKAVAP